MEREVWHALEVAVYIYEESGSGTWSGEVVRSCDYCRDGEIRQAFATNVSWQPGKSTPDLNTQPGVITAAVSEFYIRKSEQFQPFTDPAKRYRLLIKAINSNYTGESPEENDYHVLRNCVIDSTVAWRENDLVAVALNIQAERFGDYDSGE